ncbi:ADP-ribosylglycohydrolase family protein [Paenibacillus arenilitoris]|uniref:ADP-ribosylglycohydrolase family protein n=1 Tax=Paenibacillus arenilitoris TaxID=2772299 RepID=A0A927CP33_9BACL|nr:ADP-ribosylglycohydrolase family protein [Paenibacillus arenilitoris]MBD2870173.1 ADP-ribosylglycohydrolase family protein [Paenibacillus arenilitoris]
MKASAYHYLQYEGHFAIERQQGIDEGRALSEAIEAHYGRLAAMTPGDPEREALAAEYLDEMRNMPMRPDYPFAEPSDLAGIRAERPPAAKLAAPLPAGPALEDKLYGAWLGRSAGCLLGQPIEGWRRERIAGLLGETDNYPIRRYLSSAIDRGIADKYGVKDEGGSYGNPCVSWINNVRHMVEDDDMNYTIIALAVLEKYGESFTPDDVAEAWLTWLPALRTCTAERIAYRNLMNGIDPPRSAGYRNAYREWIGAQIRADFYGYINPGDAELAAEMAWRDASISHEKNGIYGAMWVAAMLAAAAVTNDMEEVILAGLGQIPAASRLSAEIRTVLHWRREEVVHEEAIDRIHRKYDEGDPHHWCHTISNAMIVAVSLLYGGGDLERTIGMAAAAGFDTDCNAATSGSVVGMQLGAEALPEAWVQPLNDLILSGVDGFGLTPISQLAKRTCELAARGGA